MKKILRIADIILNMFRIPTHLSILFHELFRKSYPVHSDKIHLDGAMDWLRTSQDTTKAGGCAGIYTFEKGWDPPYPETTGYIIPTFLNFHKRTNNPEFLERAKQMGDWEIAIQLPSGAVRGGVGINDYPIVFNTGQVILGWGSLYENTKAEKYLVAAIKASEWLVNIQDSDGKWNQYTYHGIPHTYNVRVAWALLKIYKITNNIAFKKAALKNIQWVLLQSKSNGWFDYMGFTMEEPPLTHTIAYTLRGLLECSSFVEDNLKNKIIAQVTEASEHIMSYYESLSSKNKTTQRFLPGTFDNRWKSNDTFSCLTGNAQMAIIWMKLFLIKGDERFLKNATKMIEQLKSTQHMTTKKETIRGGISGSYPIWGKYVSFGYPNWAAKFFADSILMKDSISKSKQN